MTFVPFGVINGAETSDGDEADVEFIGAAWFTCFNEIEQKVSHISHPLPSRACHSVQSIFRVATVYG